MNKLLLLLASQAYAQDNAAGAAVPTPDQMQVYIDKGIEIGGNVLIALVTLIIGWMVAGKLQKVLINQMTERKIDVAVSRFVGNIVRYMVVAATIIAALGRLGVETTSVIAILGSAGLAVGLALQGSLANFASGVLILFFRPFELGHVVTAAGHTGKVEDIGLFATTLGTPDHETIIIPNSAITGGSIVNLARKGIRRVGIDVGVAYGTDVAKVTKVLEQVAFEAPLVLDDPAPAVVFVSMGASSINFKVFVHVKWQDFVAVQGDVRTRCYNALAENDIEIPFDTITVLRGDG